MITVQIIIIVILIILSAFFSSSETALTTISQHRLKTLVDEEVKNASLLEKVLSKKTKMLSVILICNNIVNLAASALTTVVVEKLFGSVFISVGTGILTLLILIFGEISPKTLATHRAEKLALAFCPIINALMVVFTPIAAAINFLARGVIRLFGVKKGEKVESYTENEIRSIVEVSHEEGVTTSEEKEIINNVFDFTDTTVKEVMVPRINVATININSTYDEVMSVFKEDFFTRLPVYDEEGKNFVGMVNVKDLVLYDTEKKDEFSIKEVMRDIDFTYEGKHLSELFIEMKQTRRSMMGVLDEYGDIAGIVTMEDLLEEIVGEIRDEFDEAEEDEIVHTEQNIYLVQGHVSLSDLNDKLEDDLGEDTFCFESEEMDSIGGFVIEKLERIPEPGDIVELDDATITVVDMDVNKIELVKIKLKEEN